MRIRKISMSYFLIAVMIESIASNIAHPITPSIIKALSLPSYTFGLAYGMMAFASFLFAPTWGSFAKQFGTSRMYALSCLGYAFAQICFCFSKDQTTLLIARSIAGLFISGINVCQLIYVIDVTNLEHRGKHIIILTTIVSVFSTIGYLIGGIAGDISIQFAMYLQIGSLLFASLFIWMFLGSPKQPQDKFSKREVLRGCNPFSMLFGHRELYHFKFLFLMSMVLLLNIASTSFDQSFNYYIKDQFNFSPSYNGILKASVGAITLLSNFTLTMWIIKKCDLHKAFIIGTCFCGISLCALVQTSFISIFLTLYLVFFSVQTLCVTIQQTFITTFKSESSTNIVSFYNSIKALGMIIGAIVAGGLYEFNVKGPFLFSALIFFMVMIGMYIFREHE